MGDRVGYLREAVQRLGEIVTVHKVSQLYVEAPLGYVQDDAFINAALQASTDLPPMKLFTELQTIEQAMGRRRVQYGPRPIDLDLLFYDSIELETPGLIIPHPRIAERAFVLKPLADIAPDFVHPVLYYTITQLLQDADDTDRVRLYTPE
jgi:2-amino-4-hydroxy-6-hydroxymethyldihydropteridine diphosphokinase